MSNVIDGSSDNRFQRGEPIKIEERNAETKFISNRLREVTTGEVLSNLGSNEIASYEFNHGLIIFDTIESAWLAFCCPSPEAIEHNESNQDKIGVISIDEARLLVLQADGVGSSYDAQNASGYAVRETGQRGSVNLQQNLERIGEDFKNWGASVAKPRADLPDMVVQASNETRLHDGTQTTFNQYLINRVTGIFRAHILGDGYYSIVRDDGNVEMYPVGDHRNRLTTRNGIEGNAAEFGGQLRDGDLMIIYSDGMDGLTHQQIKDLRDRVINGDPQATTQYLEELVQSLKRDDDRSLFAYRHKSTQTLG